MIQNNYFIACVGRITFETEEWKTYSVRLTDTDHRMPQVQSYQASPFPFNALPQDTPTKAIQLIQMNRIRAAMICEYLQSIRK